MKEESLFNATPVTTIVLVINIKSVQPKIKSFKCDNCDYSCSLKANLKRHIKSIHEGMKPFQCGICDYRCHFDVITVITVVIIRVT